ncbi:MAG: DUF839 domain-containing protein [Thermoleophilia bacterium]
MRKTLVATGVAAAIAGISALPALANTITGPSSSQSPYLVPTEPGVVVQSLLTVGDTVPRTGGLPGETYALVGIPDGLGAFDNGDGTFTLLANHELRNTQGAVRAHGAAGSFVSRWIVEKGSLKVRSGTDLIERIYAYGPSGWAQVSGPALALNRLCSADLAPISAFYAERDDRRGRDRDDRRLAHRDRGERDGVGYKGRLFLNGEENDQGRAFAHALDGTSYDITPWLGSFAWENSVAHPDAGRATVVVGTDDGTGGQVYVYVGEKQRAGNPVERAGLTNGRLYGVRIVGVPQAESAKADWAVGDSFRFELVDVSGSRADAATLEAGSNAAGVTSFQRPEDAAWDPDRTDDLYVATTASFTGNSRLWQLRFDDASNPTRGGTITLKVNGPAATTDGPKMMDNLTVDDGRVVVQEDPGNQPYLASIWSYGIRSGELRKVAQHDPNRFDPAVASPLLTQDEESSGIIPLDGVKGGNWFVGTVQAHYALPGELVEGGQLFAIRIPKRGR